MADLDADEDQSRGDRGGAGRPGEGGGCDGHVRLLFRGPWLVPRDVRNVRRDVGTGRHQMW
jgi:hypothetical protein